jgi:transcription elongation factor GreA
LETYDNDLAPTRAPLEQIATGSSVTLKTLGETEEWSVTIVSSLEADPEAAFISDQCPVGEALLGRGVGDVIAIDVPVGQVRCQVVSVSRAPADPASGRA